MRAFGTIEQLANRRERALRLLRQGIGPAEVAQRVGATRQSEYRWLHASHLPKRKSKGQSRRPGRPNRLTEAAQRRLTTVLKRGAFANGWAENYWTLDRIAHLIWNLFGIRYYTSSGWDGVVTPSRCPSGKASTTQPGAQRASDCALETLCLAADKKSGLSFRGTCFSSTNRAFRRCRR